MGQLGDEGEVGDEVVGQVELLDVVEVVDEVVALREGEQVELVSESLGLGVDDVHLPVSYTHLTLPTIYSV